MGQLQGNFGGRTVLVTGASGGLGQAISLAFADAGATVALHYNSNEPFATVAKINSTGGKGAAFAASFSEPEFEAALLDQVVSTLGPVDILINCAADQRLDNEASLAQIFATNTLAVAALSRAFAARATNGAAIVNISSIEARHPAPGHANYGASKAALENLTRAMATDLGPRGIRVNAIAPGLIERPDLNKDWPEGVTRWTASCPLGRTGRPEDVAAAVLFLASSAAAWITGTVLFVDGGTSAGPGW